MKDNSCFTGNSCRIIIGISGVIMLCAAGAKTQVPDGRPGGEPNSLANINPDPNGEPWLSGGITREEWDRVIAGVPALALAPRQGLYKMAPAPSKADNSIFSEFRPIFNQKGGSCAQASSIGYVFTYEMNAARGLSGNIPQNQYPYDFTYNFCNNGSGSVGSMPNQGFGIAMTMGIPNVQAYGGFGLGKFSQWVSGYETYRCGMENRADSQFTIVLSTAQGIATMKAWLADHGNGSPRGGCLVFCYDANGSQIVSLAGGTPEAGKKVMIRNGTGGGHAVTIAGYNDSVRYDYNGDGKFTNNIDINRDGKVDVRDWEIGAVIMVNSWGTSYGNSGKIYVPYKFAAEGMWKSTVYGMRVSPSYRKPLMTYKVSLTHNQRNLIRLRAGYANSATAAAPGTTPKTWGYAFNYCGGGYPMQGISASPIEIGLDVSDFVSRLTTTEASFFLLVDSKGGNGVIKSFALLDYSGGPQPDSAVCQQKDVSFTTGTTTLKIARILSRLKVSIPNGGEQWECDRTFPISWSDHVDEPVAIELLKGDKEYLVVTPSTPSTGEFLWRIPDSCAAGSDYKIRISSVSDGAISDVSDSSFSIGGMSLFELTFPYGGEYFDKRKPLTIAWNSTIASKVKIDLYKNNMFDTTIAASVPNTGSYLWTTLAGLPTAFEYSLRITPTDNSWIHDESHTYFAIVNQGTGVPYTQNFDAFPDTVLPNDWDQASDDDLNWTLWKGPTPSKTNAAIGGGGTGPNGDHTSGFGKFAYLEASASNNPGKSGCLLSPLLNVSRLTNARICFWSHMYSRGAHMGELWVDLNIDGVWEDSVLYLTGDHGDQWFRNTITLDTGSRRPTNVLARFRARTGSDYDSDICIDDFSIDGDVVSVAQTVVPTSILPGIVRRGNSLLLRNGKGTATVFSLNGVRIVRIPAAPNGVVDISRLPRGMYLAKAGGEILKFLR